MESQGARLKQIRLEKGLSLEDVHARTKIHTDIIKSLEDDAFVNLSPVYRKSFLKIYCQFLGVNPSEFSAETAPAEEPARPLGTQGSRTFLKRPVPRARPTVVTKVVVAALGVVVCVVLILGAVNVVRFIGSRMSAGKRHKKASTAFSIQKPAVKNSPLSTQRPAAHAASRSTAAAGAETGIQVSMQALDDVWVRVLLDSKVVFQNILKKGRSESWNAKDKVMLTIGSAGSVRLEVNGKIYESLGQKGQVLKDLVINKDGSLVSAAR